MLRGRGGLTTRGRCLLAAGFAAALCALLLNERDLIRVAAFVVALPLLSALVVRRTRLGLRATRELLPAQTPVGSRCQVQLTVRRTRRFAGRATDRATGRSTGRLLGAGLLLEDGVPEVLGATPRFVLPRIPRAGAVALRYPLYPPQRGIHSLGPLVAQVTDPFGLAEHSCELTGPSRLVVVPEVVPLSGTPAGGGLDTVAERADRLRSGPGTDAVVVRSYRHGDDLRTVHWRSTARRDELMVRVEEQPRPGDVLVLLDRRVEAHRGVGPAASLEYAVSLAASICVHLQGRGQRIRLVTTDGQVLAEDTGYPNQSGALLLDALAALVPAQAGDITCGPALADGPEVIAVLGAAGPAAVEQLLRHRRRELPGHAVLLDVAAWAGTGPDPAETSRLLGTAGWSVVVAEPDQPAWLVWERLCLNSRSRQGSLR